MRAPGDNLPEFRQRQLEFAAHVRNPEGNPPPGGVDARRMAVYVRLVYNNIESFLARSFPVCKRVLGDACWAGLAREFVHRHGSESPYFRDIPQEFLSFLSGRHGSNLPDFLLELAHYEWVEVYLATAPEEIPEAGLDPAGDLYSRPVAVSPLIWKLAYRYPVHLIGPDHQPDGPGPLPTYIVVYRRRDDRVRFMVVNALTMALLEELETPSSGAEALSRLVERLSDAGGGAGTDADTLHKKGIETLERLRKAEIVLGTRDETGE